MAVRVLTQRTEGDATRCISPGVAEMLGRGSSWGTPCLEGAPKDPTIFPNWLGTRRVQRPVIAETF